MNETKDESKFDQRGFVAEDFVIDNFLFDGSRLVKSNREDDIKRDIDAYHQTLGNVSIKSQDAKYFNVSIEHTVAAYQSYSKGEDGKPYHKDKIDGWYKTSEADTYIFAIRDEGGIKEAYIANKQVLDAYIEANPVKDTWCLYARANNRGRYFDLPYVWLYNIKKLVKAGVLKRYLF